MKHALGKSIKIISYHNSINILASHFLIISSSYIHIIYGHPINLSNNNNNNNNAKVPALLVFGDSIVDSGNNDYINTVGKVNFPPYGRDFQGGKATGRYSNGKIPSDLLAEEIGIKELVPPYLDPTLQINDLLTGVSFASGTAGYDPQTSKAANAISLDEQLNLFRQYINKLKAAVGENTTVMIISQSVYLVCAGSNDITNTYLTTQFQSSRNNIFSTYTTSMANWASTFVQELYSLGARKIGVISAPPCGCLPSQRTFNGGLARDCAQEENRVSIMYNNKLMSNLNSLNQKLSGSTIVYLDIYTSLLNLINYPSQSGFEVVNRGCCGTGYLAVGVLCTKLSIGTCEDASKYVFWDSFHPTEAAYRIIVHDIVQRHHNLFF